METFHLTKVEIFGEISQTHNVSLYLCVLRENGYFPGRFPVKSIYLLLYLVLYFRREREKERERERERESGKGRSMIWSKT